MGPTKVASNLNKTLHLTGIGLAVQAFYINLTLDSALGGEYIELRPVGPPVINPSQVWDIKTVPVLPAAYGGGGVNQDVARMGVFKASNGNNNGANGFVDRNGFYHDNTGLKNGYDVGKTYGGGRDYGITTVQGASFGDINGRNKGHQVAGFSTNYQKNESGNKATYYDDGLGHGGVVQYGLKDQRFRDGAGNAYGGGYHDTSLKQNTLGAQGQYGNAAGYAGGENRDIHTSSVDGYRAGGGQIIANYIPSPQPVVTNTVVVQKPLPVSHHHFAYVPAPTPTPVPVSVPVAAPVPVPVYTPVYKTAVEPVYPIIKPQYPVHYTYTPQYSHQHPQQYPQQYPVVNSLVKSSGQYIVPTPTKLYYDKPNILLG